MTGVSGWSGYDEPGRLRADEFGAGVAAYLLWSLAASFGDPLIPVTGDDTGRVAFTAVAAVLNGAVAVAVVHAFHRATGRAGAAFGLRLGATWTATALLLNAGVQAAGGFRWPGLPEDRTGTLVLAQLAGWGAFLLGSWIAAARLGPRRHPVRPRPAA